MKFTITNTFPPGVDVAYDAFDAAVGVEHTVTYEGQVIGGAVLTDYRVKRLHREVELMFETDGLIGLAVQLEGVGDE